MFFFPIGDEDPRPGFVPYVMYALIGVNLLFFAGEFVFGFKASFLNLGMSCRRILSLYPAHFLIFARGDIAFDIQHVILVDFRG